MDQPKLSVDALLQALQDSSQNLAQTSHGVENYENHLKKMKTKKIHVEQKISSRVSQKLDRAENYQVIKSDMKE